MDSPTPEPDFDDPKELWAFFGLAFYAAQVLEQGLLNLFVAVCHAGGTVSLEEVDRLFAHGDKKTFGQVFGEVRKHSDLPSCLERRLEEAVSMRNDLAHKFFSRHDIDLLSESGRHKMIRELRSAIEFLKQTDTELDRAWHHEWSRLGVTEQMRDRIYQEMQREADGWRPQ